MKIVKKPIAAGHAQNTGQYARIGRVTSKLNMPFKDKLLNADLDPKALLKV